MANGKYVLFLNSDDYLTKRALESIAQAMRGDPDYIYGQQETLFCDGRKSLWTRMSPSNFLIRMPFGHGSMAFKRDKFLELGGYDLTFKICSDYDLVMRLLLSGGVGVHVPAVICTFREGGVSGDFKATSAEHVAVLRKNLAPFIDLSGYTKAQMTCWVQTGIFPWSVGFRLACNPSIPSVLRHSAVKTILSGTKKRIIAPFRTGRQNCA